MMANKWQTFFLLVLTLPIMGHVVLLPFAIELAGRDSWMSALFSFPIGCLFIYSIYKLRLKYKKKYVHDSLHHLLGPVMTKVTTGFFLVYFFFLAILSLAAVTEMVRAGFLVGTPFFVIVLIFLLLSMYGATKTVKGIALTAGILFFTVMFTGHSITFINFPERDLNDLLPLLENGWKPVWLGTMLFSTTWIEALFLIVIPIENIREKRFLFVWFLSVLANITMMLSTLSGAIMTFGLGQAESFTHPALEIVRIVNLNFIDRLDVYAVILMTFGSYIRCSLFIKISHRQARNLFNIEHKWISLGLFLLISILIGVIAYFIGETRIHFESGLIAYAYTIVLYPLPFILLLIAWLRQRRKIKEKPNAS